MSNPITGLHHFNQPLIHPGGLVRQGALALLAARPGERILEIGPGTGRGLVALAQAVGTAGWVCGIDLSAGMLRQASRRVKRAGAAQQVTLCRADGLALPYQAQVFDAAFLSFTLELFDDPQRSALLQEIARVVRPGDRLAVAALAQGGGRMVSVYQWAHRRFPRLVDCRLADVQRFEGRSARVAGLVTGARSRARCRPAGWAEVQPRPPGSARPWRGSTPRARGRRPGPRWR